MWSSKNLSFAGRSRLINCIIFGMFSYWASIFLLPTEVTTKLTQLCRNYLWGASEEYKRPPFISWSNSCQPRTHGGLGIKDMGCWNKALTAKLVWAVATKKDTLWVRWVHGRYLKGSSWWSYNPPVDSGWHWKKVCFIKELFKDGYTENWKWLGGTEYSVKKGYYWLLGERDKVKWAAIPWCRPVQCKHGYITWIMLHRRLPTKARLSRFETNRDTLCVLCEQHQEDDYHLFFSCTFATAIWEEIRSRWQIPLPKKDWDETIRSWMKVKGSRTHRSITYAYLNAGVYFIWMARNMKLFQNQDWPVFKVAAEIKLQVRSRILYLNMKSRKYGKYIDHIV